MALFELTNKLEFFGLVYTLILAAGLYQVGNLIFKIKPIKKVFSDVSEIKYQNIFISTNFVLLIFSLDLILILFDYFLDNEKFLFQTP